MQAKHLPSHKGFTFLDILMALAIAAILTTLVIPAFAAVIHSTKTRTVSHSLLGLLNYAREEAVNYGTQVVICPSVSNACSDDWKNPLMVFIDDNKNEELDGGEKILNISDIIAEGESLTWRASLNRPYISFDALGTTGYQNGRLYFCDDTASPAARAQVIVYRTGRSRIAKESEFREGC